MSSARSSAVRGGCAPLTALAVCPDCASDAGFDRPECVDGHGSECPERACRACGAALLIGPAVSSGPVPVPVHAQRELRGAA